MKIFLRLAARIDEKAFLSFRLWQFSLRNIARHFFWHYLFHALLRHPVRAVAGARHYRRLVSQSHGAPLSGTLDLQEFGDLPEAAKLLIAPGYCMKPYDYEKGRSVCPAGHFNHQCRLLDEATTLLRARERWPAPCRRCSVAPLAEKAAQMRADFYIMTSAMDIARDVYIPATRQKSVQYGLFFLCPYSFEPFMFGLATAGIKGALIAFCHGACSNHDEWTRADVGFKNDQTFVADDLWQEVLRLLEDQRHVRRCDKEASYHFDGHVYRVLS